MKNTWDKQKSRYEYGSMKDNDKAFYREIIDAMPLIIFIVDDDVKIHDLNKEASNVFHLRKSQVYDKRGGEVLNCVHSLDKGCGKDPHCKDCIIRNSVAECFEKHATTRKRTRVDLKTGNKVRSIDLLITTQPFKYTEKKYALLILEDISELINLKRLIPICANCKKIRDDKEYWQSVEKYFQDNVGVDFSHGICPDCMAKEMEKLKQYESALLKKQF